MDETSEKKQARKSMKPLEISFFSLRIQAYKDLEEVIKATPPDTPFAEILEDIKAMQFVESDLELHQKFINASVKVIKTPLSRSYRDLALSILNSSLSIESQRLSIESTMAKTSSKH